MARAEARAGDRARQIFERLDADGDGRLGPDALANARGGSRFGRLVARFDEDGDGGLSKAEFEAARSAMRPRMGGRRH